MQPIAQLGDMLRSMIMQEHRVQAQRGVYGLLLLCHLPDSLPVRLMHAKHQDALDASNLAAFDYIGPVVVEGVEVEMRVGVDQTHIWSPWLIGWGKVSGSSLPRSGYC